MLTLEYTGKHVRNNEKSNSFNLKRNSTRLFISNINYFKTAFLRVIYSIKGSAAWMSQPAYTYAAIVNKSPVPLIHTSLCILSGCINHIVCSIHNIIIHSAVMFTPSVCLVAAWQNKYKTNKRISVPDTQHDLSCNRVKSQRSARFKNIIAMTDKLNYSIFNFGCTPGS